MSDSESEAAKSGAGSGAGGSAGSGAESAAGSVAEGGADGGVMSYAGGSADRSADEHLDHGIRRFLHSLQFRIICVVTLAGFLSMVLLSLLAYHRIGKSTGNFIDEELSQIASVVINYNMIIPRRWEAPRQPLRSPIQITRDGDGNIILSLGRTERNNQLRELMRRQEEWLLQGNDGSAEGAAQSHSDASIEPADGRDERDAKHGIIKGPPPSLNDISHEYDIIIAPIYGRPGDPLYIPPGVSDGFYTVLIADERVRAFVATNNSGQRFVVARPLHSMDMLSREAFKSTLQQFFLIDLIAIPLIIIIGINIMMRSLNRIAVGLYKRSEDDLSPVIRKGSREFVPSELDGFIVSINRLFARVDESMQMKRRFIADAAHEMRTQSTVLSLQIGSLDGEELSESARNKVRRLKAGIAREKELMTSLLTLAREQGSSDFQIESISILDFYASLIEAQSPMADDKNIDLGVEGGADFVLVTDRSRLTRIMSNLLSNALKYTPENGRVDLMAQRLQDGSLMLSVQDDGKGIPQEHMRHILEPFYRVDGDRSKVQGTGLGLAIVKAGCDSLKASLRFSNVSPHGLRVDVVLRDMTPATRDQEERKDATD